MNQIFETFKPRNTLVAKYVDYYYLDLKPFNLENQFDCFPHFNNTISLYKSHIRSANGDLTFKHNAQPIQIFTPIRQQILHVKQMGPVHRIVIVFHPLGINQFYNSLNLSRLTTEYSFFATDELFDFFATTAIEELTALLDQSLVKRHKSFYHEILQRAIGIILNNCRELSVTQLSNELNISRQHLNRLFQHHLGISVKKFHEIAWFRATMNRKLNGFKGNFTDIAYEFNYADQSHFNKIYKKFTRNSPKSFFSKGTILGNEDTYWHIYS
ncbi:hypothetical protein GCM10023231_12230 [Olivibacter ginsenosidimutans]|uniref:HTH araC/xylS-type domain-containing protein n=1 Tax=Olivibacter ginsenosidimutans TaxID=1176537 RepID=A0ABP9AVA3_9SPHI